MRIALAACLALLAATPAAAAQAAAPPVEVMIVAAFHMANPGKDGVNLTVDDVLAPKRQAEIKAVADTLARFRPTLVGAEWPADTVTQRYAAYRAGSLAPSRNEVVQLGFRLAQQAGARMVGLDVSGDFPFEAVQTYAEAHGQSEPLHAAQAQLEANSAAEAKILETNSVGALLWRLNEPARLARDHGFYRTTLRVGGGADQPGVDLLTAWYRRNALICASLIQTAKPGDRVVLFFGAGHAFLLRQCVTETPGFKLVEARAWLPPPTPGPGARRR